MDYQEHEAANAFPMMGTAELNELADDIQMNGMRVPITLIAGKILDGRNRLKACQIANVTPTFVNFPEGADPYLWVWSMNATRRHLSSQEQKAIIWHNLYGMSEQFQKARERIKDEADKARAEAAAEGRVGRAAANFSGCTDCTTTKPGEAKTRAMEAEAAGVNKGAMARAQALKGKSPELAAAVASGAMKYSDAAREAKRAELLENLASVEAIQAKEISGVYDVIVIDPPWPMQKIERDVRENQSEFDYPTMTEEELELLDIPLAESAHVWLWTTHRFLPMAFRLLDAWRLKYVCLFTWHKPGGFQPFGLPQYNSEFAIYARAGSPQFVDTKQFNVCFNAPRGAHSEKPDEFYDLVRRVTAGRRLDMFNRRTIDGFTVWGKEAAE